MNHAIIFINRENKTKLVPVFLSGLLNSVFDALACSRAFVFMCSACFVCLLAWRAHVLGLFVVWLRAHVLGVLACLRFHGIISFFYFYL